MHVLKTPLIRAINDTDRNIKAPSPVHRASANPNSWLSSADPSPSSHLMVCFIATARHNFDLCLARLLSFGRNPSLVYLTLYHEECHPFRYLAQQRSTIRSHILQN